MGTGILIGIALCLFLESLVWLGFRAWRQTLPPRLPQPPETPGQLANRALYEAQTRYHPRVVSLRVQRRTRRGRALLNMEDEEGFIEE